MPNSLNSASSKYKDKSNNIFIPWSQVKDFVSISFTVDSDLRDLCVRIFSGLLSIIFYLNSDNFQKEGSSRYPQYEFGHRH